MIRLPLKRRFSNVGRFALNRVSQGMKVDLLRDQFSSHVVGRFLVGFYYAQAQETKPAQHTPELDGRKFRTTLWR